MNVRCLSPTTPRLADIQPKNALARTVQPKIKDIAANTKDTSVQSKFYEFWQCMFFEYL